MSKIDENHSSLHFPLQLSWVKMEMVSQSEYEGFFVFCNVMEGRKRRRDGKGVGWYLWILEELGGVIAVSYCR